MHLFPKSAQASAPILLCAGQNVCTVSASCEIVRLVGLMQLQGHVRWFGKYCLAYAPCPRQTCSSEVRQDEIAYGKCLNQASGAKKADPATELLEAR